MVLTAAGQRTPLISAEEAGGPVTLTALNARYPDLGGDDVGRGVVRLAMTGLVAMRREGKMLQVAFTPSWARGLGGGAMCRRAGWRTRLPVRRAAAVRITSGGVRVPVLRAAAIACARRPGPAMRDGASRAEATR